MAENTKKLNDESAKMSSQTIPQFQALVKIAQDVTESEERRAGAIKELNEQYPDFNANILQEGNNTDTVNTAIAEYINKLGQKAKAQASMNMIQEKYNELILIEQEREQLRQNILDKANENRKLNNKELFKTQEEAIAFYQKISDALDANAEKGRRSEQATNNFAVALDSLNNKNDELSDKQDEINSLMDIYIENVDLSSKTVKKLTKEEEDNNNEKGKAIGLIDSLIFGYESYARAKEKAFKESTNIFEDGTFVQPEVLNDTEEQFGITFDNITDITRRAFGIMTSLSDAYFDRQFANLEKEKETALGFANDSATARAEIERQYDEKRKQIEKRQATAKKNQALFDITVDTASAVVRALPNIPLSVAVGVLGAAQLALVASQQIPQFWQGGEVGGMHDIIVNDDPYGVKGSNYKEVIEKPNGQILTPQGKNVKMRVPKGSYVHPTYDAFINSLDNELINNNIMPIGQSNIMPMIINDGLTKADVMEVMSAHGKGVVRAINNKESFKLNIDERGINKYVTKNGNTKKIMNARYSGKGIGV
jgi:hypothetical protein